MAVLEHLKRRLQLKRIPLRIECFDNSNLGGTEPVASQVVFEKGRKRADHYRRYRIKSVEHQDDYAYLAEVLRRRYGKGRDSEPLPDLLVVDGGKGQLNIARAVLSELKLEGVFDVVGIAKPDKRRGEQDDKIFKPGQANPVQWGRNRDGLLLLQHIRDEAHRSAVTYQRRRRHKRSLQSVLDTISGIGPKRKAALILKFKSLNRIREARMEDLIQVPGISRKLAEVVIEQLGEKTVSSGNPI
jgi:excinuclease ABC subunit C